MEDRNKTEADKIISEAVAAAETTPAAGDAGEGEPEESTLSGDEVDMSYDGSMRWKRGKALDKDNMSEEEREKEESDARFNRGKPQDEENAEVWGEEEGKENAGVQRGWQSGKGAQEGDEAQKRYEVEGEDKDAEDREDDEEDEWRESHHAPGRRG